MNKFFRLSLILYFIFALILWFIKPSFMFDDDKNMRQFGTGKNKTIFYYPLALIVIAMIIYFISLQISLKIEYNSSF